MITYSTGDVRVATKNYYAFAHGCNCRGYMGCGIALAFRNRWPMMFDKYVYDCQSSRFRPGDCFKYVIPDEYGSNEYIFNLASQDDIGACARYNYVASSCNELKSHIHRHNQSIYDISDQLIRTVLISTIGCGVGGLQWSKVRQIFHDVFDDASFDLSVLIDFVPRQKIIQISDPAVIEKYETINTLH